MDYKDKLKDPRWISRKRDILIRDKYTCRLCGSHGKDGNELHVHHLFYITGHEPWNYGDRCLVTLCDRCHQSVHRNNIKLRLRQSVISDKYLCEEADVDWTVPHIYEDNCLLVHKGTILSSDEVNKIFVAADYPHFTYNDYNGEEKLPFTHLPKNIEVEALFTYDKNDGQLSINEYVFPLSGIFSVKPRYATSDERSLMLNAICNTICFYDNGTHYNEKGSSL